MATLTGEQLKDSYQSLVTIGDSITSNPTSGVLENGKGNAITSLTLGGDLIVQGGTSANLFLQDTGATDGVFKLKVNGDIFSVQTSNDSYGFIADVFQIDKGANEANFKIHDGGDISFRDTSTNEAFYWDADVARLGIGTQTPNSKLNVISNGVGTGIWVGPTNSNFGLEQWYDSATGTVYFDQKYNNNGGSIFFRTKTLGTPVNALTILGSGNVGIGTQTPSEKLQIVDSANDVHVRIGSGNAGINPTLRFHGKNTADTTNVYADIRVNPDNQTLGFSGTGTSGGSIEQDALVIDSSGNVGIGTTSPSSYWVNADDLVVSTSGNTGISVVSGTSSFGYLIFADSTAGGDNTRGGLSYDHNTNNMLFRVNNDTKMTIDSSGNVGIGVSPDVAGFPSTTLTVEGSSGNYGAFELGSASQTSNNGRLGEIRFYNKESANPYGFASIRGLRGSSAGDSHISFFTSSSNTGTERMRILSSGGITFNGDTATANALDDYEEGTFTPTLTYATPGTLSVTYDAGQTGGKYTKIGRQVTIELKLVLTAFTKGTASGNLLIGGLPFTSTSSTSSIAIGSFMGFNYTSGISADNLALTRAIVLENDTHIRVLRMQANGGFTTDDPDADSQFFVSATYFV